VLVDSGRVGARRRVRTLRELVVVGLVASGLTVSGAITFDQAVAAAVPPAVVCSTTGSTLNVQLSGQSSASDTLGISASGGDYIVYLGSPANPQCSAGGPYSLASEPDVDVTSTGMVSQYVTLDDTNGQLASSAAGCPAAFTVSFDTPSSGTDSLALLDDSSSPAAGDDTVAVSSSSSAGSTTESLNLSEGGCSTPDVSVPATTSPPDVDVTGQAGSGDVLDLSGTTTSASPAITVDANGDSAGSPGSVSGEPGAIAVGFSGIETVLGAGFDTDFQPGIAPDVQFKGQTGVTNTFDLSSEGAPATGLVVDVPAGTVSGISSAGGSLNDTFSEVQDFIGSPVGASFETAGSGGLSFTGDSPGTSLDVGAAPSGTTLDAPAGTVTGLSAGVGASTTDEFSGIQEFTGSSAGTTTFDVLASGGLSFTGQSTGNSLDVGAAPSGTTLDAPAGTVTGLSAGVGSSTTDSFSDVTSFTGSSSGSTAFDALASGGLSFTGQGSGNSLDVGAAPSGAQFEVASGTVTGLSAGVGSSTTDSFSGVQVFTGSSAGSTTFDALASGGLSFTGQGAGNVLNVGTAPSGARIDASTGVVSGLSAGVASSTTDSFSGVTSFTGSSSGSTTFDALASGGLTFTGQGTGDSLVLSTAPSGATLDAPAGTVTGLSAGVGSSTHDAFSGIQTFTGSSSGSTTFDALASGGLTFTGQGSGNSLVLSAAPTGATLDESAGTVTGLSSGVGASTTDSFSGVTSFTGSSAGSTAFDALGTGGLTFTGQGAGNSLVLSAAQSGTKLDASTGIASGLLAGAGSSTTDSFSGIQDFTGSSAGSTSFDAAASGGLSFTGGGSDNVLDLSAAPTGSTLDASTGTVSGLSTGVGSSTSDSFTDVTSFTGSSSGSTAFDALASGGLTFTGQGSGNSLDLSVAPTGTTLDAPADIVSGLTAGVGASTTDSFSGIQGFTGSSAGSTGFDALASGGLTFTGQGTGNSLDLGTAPSGANLNAPGGTVSGLTAGVGASTTDSFSGIQSFTGSSAGSTTFAPLATGGLTFTGQGTGNSLNLAAAPTNALVDIGENSQASPGIVSALGVGFLGSTTDAFSDISSFSGPLAPSEPTGPTATPLDAAASVLFVAPATDFGSPITSYTVTAIDLTTSANGGEHASGPSSPVTVSGLTNGDSYDFTVTASNGNGTGPSSLVSSAVTPKKTQSVHFTTSTPDMTRVGGASYEPTALATSGLPVTITLDAASTGCVLSNDIVSYPAGGDCIIDANQSGGGIYAPAPTVQQRIAILKSINAITFTSAPPRRAVVPDSYRPTATATSGDTVTIRVAAHLKTCTLKKGIVTFLARGVCVVIFLDSGNAIFLPAPERIQRFVIAKGTVTVRASAVPRAASSSRSITLRAVVSSILAHGSIRFTIGGVALCAAALHHRVATCRVTRVLGAGVYKVTASYSGSASFDTASGTTDLKVT
jgi:large repetitive protein